MWLIKVGSIRKNNFRMNMSGEVFGYPKSPKNVEKNTKRKKSTL